MLPLNSDDLLGLPVPDAIPRAETVVPHARPPQGVRHVLVLSEAPVSDLLELKRCYALQLLRMARKRYPSRVFVPETMIRLYRDAELNRYIDTLRTLLRSLET